MCKKCVYLKPLNKHPSNIIFKGSIKEHTGLYVCMFPDGNEGVIFEEHMVLENEGGCEEYELSY